MPQVSIRPTITTIPTAPTTSIISLSCYWLYYYRYYCYYWLLLLLPLYSHQLLLYIAATLMYNSYILLLMYPLSYQLPEQLTAINSLMFTQLLKIVLQLLRHTYSNYCVFIVIIHYYITSSLVVILIISCVATFCYIFFEKSTCILQLHVVLYNHREIQERRYSLYIF